MDAGVVVGYLVSYLTGKAKDLADQAVDGLLERLYAKVAVRLRDDPAMGRLEQDPADDQAQADLLQSLSQLATANEDAAVELRGLLGELEQAGGQQLLVDAPVHGQVFQQVTASHGSVVGSIGRDVNIYQDPQAHAAQNLRNSPRWVKTFMVLGALLFLVVGPGILVLGVGSVFLGAQQGGPPEFPVVRAALGAGTILLGMALFIIGGFTGELRQRR